MIIRLFLIICCCFSVTLAFSQTAKKPIVKSAVPELKKLLSETGLPYKLLSDSLAVIPYEGANISSYNVLVQKVSDLYIVYTNLTEALPGKITEGKYKYLLQQNDHFDIVKIGMSGDENMVYLRADIYRAGTSSSLLNRIIRQVANVTNIIGGDLK